MLKNLRIAVTALSLTACALLIALWVRSLWYQHAVIGGYSTYLFNFQSQRGEFEFLIFDPSDPEVEVVPTWRLESNPINWPNNYHLTEAPQIFSYLGMGWRFAPSGFHIFFPHWTLVAMCAILTVSAWIPWSRRFSIRTLVIATTLVAVVLGIVVAAM